MGYRVCGRCPLWGSGNNYANNKIPEGEVMHWTTTKPDRPGWYWWRPCKGVVPMVTQVYTLIGHIYVKHDSGEWAGPIEKPTEGGGA